MKAFVYDMWLAFGVIGMAIGLAAPFVALIYTLWVVVLKLLS